jgi:hypothetical protein
MRFSSSGLTRSPASRTLTRSVSPPLAAEARAQPPLDAVGVEKLRRDRPA